jgi:transposase
MSDYWAKAPCPREQLVLFPTSIDSMIPPDHQVRLFAELLDLCDWSAWEARYHGRIGQPPIHPKIVAGLLLYGLRNQVRSSRRLEYMASHAIDFIWLAEGHRPDHSTICEFRTRFATELRDLFQQVIRIALKAGALSLAEVAFDGTRVKANNNRYATWTAEKLESRIAELAKEFDAALAELSRNDSEGSSPGGD